MKIWLALFDREIKTNVTNKQTNKQTRLITIPPGGGNSLNLSANGRKSQPPFGV